MSLDWTTAPADAAAHFARRLAVETDVSDVHAALESGDARLRAARQPQRRVVGAGARAGRGAPARPGDRRAGAAELDRSVPVVTYCWGPAATAPPGPPSRWPSRGFRVREMIGGFEYWAREGLPVETADGVHRPAVDLLTAPAGISCGC